MTEKKERANKKVNGQQPKPFIAPNSPTYPPYYIDVPVVYDPNDPNHPPPPPPPQTTTAYAYIYPVSPQYSVQYYSAENARYGSYPGSPVLHPHLHYTSPPLHPSSPPFSPTLQYHQPTLSPPTHAFVVPHQQPFPPLHISSPILNASGSPPHLQFIQPVELKHRQEEKENVTQLHPQNIYVRGLSSNETDESFLELVSV